MLFKMRRYIRHPTDIPLRITAGESIAPDLKNVSSGGLCFETDEILTAGTQIRIEIPIDNPPFCADAVVVWCHAFNGHHQVGVRFVDEQSAFTARMVEQVCQIQKDTLQLEGRRLSGEQAAREWIAKHAADFPA
jgi:hypothetical protein